MSSENEVELPEGISQVLKRLPKSEAETLTKIIKKGIEDGIRAGISSTSKSDGVKVVTARDRITDSGHRVGKEFPAQANETQRIANLVSAIYKNQFLEHDEKMQAIGMIRPESSRSFMNELYLNTIADGEIRLAESILEKISPERLARMRKENLI